MSWGFEIGRVYNRRTDILGKFGRQQQGGIVTPANHALVLIITGEEGLAHGYCTPRPRPRLLSASQQRVQKLTVQFQIGLSDILKNWTFAAGKVHP
jgi:hypothetical protein